MNSNPCRSSTFPKIADRGQKSSEDLPITQFPVPCIPSAVNGLLKVEGERERTVKSEKKREGGREREGEGISIHFKINLKKLKSYRERISTRSMDSSQYSVNPFLSNSYVYSSIDE